MTNDLADRYARDGFVAPLRVMSADEARAEIVGMLENRLAARIGDVPAEVGCECRDGSRNVVEAGDCVFLISH